MLAQAGGYHGKEFHGFRGVTQGDPLSPTIFNMVVDAVANNWVEKMVERACGQGGRGREEKHQKRTLLRI